MENKNVGLPDFYAPVKRIECLLEEILFRQIAYNSLSESDANETFKSALKNVNKSLEDNINNLSNLE
ncbi:MAG TPA: hypothetical protein VGQ09_05635 [Chitinophagaceae bacterium]|jgi:hypothetical protein|nr:hypothetical protein [Chitinophagaceae bacterium]